MITCYFDAQTKVKLRHLTANALVLDKNKKLLLVKRSPNSIVQPDKWTIPGGYLDHGETLHQGVIREVFEESGWQIKPGPLFRINDNPLRKGDELKQNVTLIFLAKPLNQTGHFDHEVSKIKWFDLDNLPSSSEIAFDHYHDLVLFKKHLIKPFDLPLFGQD